jgi:hypothetical protein
MNEETIFREIDEDLRREQLQKLWEKYGVYVIGAALAIVLGVAGNNGWRYWKAKQAATSGERFETAVMLTRGEDKRAAMDAFADIAANSGSGYAVLARLRMAAALASEEKIPEAVEIFTEIADDRSVNAILRDFAGIQAAMLRVDDASYDEMQQRLKQFTMAGSRWMHTAHELMGISAYRAGLLNEAADHYQQAISIPNAPAGLQQRAEMMLAIIATPQAASGKAPTVPPLGDMKEKIKQ